MAEAGLPAIDWPHGDSMARILSNHISREMFLLWVLEFLLAFLVFYVLLLPGDASGTAFGMPGLDLQTTKSASMLGLTVGLTSIAIGLYRPEICLQTRRLLVNSVVAGVVGFPVILLMSLATHIDPSFLLGHDALWPMKMLLSWMLVLFATRLVMRLLVRLDILTRNILIVGSSEQADGLAAAITAMPRQFFKVSSVVAHGNIADVTEHLLDTTKIWGVVVMASAAGQNLPLEQLLTAKTQGVRVFGDVMFREQQLRRMDLDALTSNWVLYADGVTASPLAAVIRRGGEIIVGLIGLIVTLPVLIVAGLAIKLDSPGPILYRQERVGLRGKPFTLFKLRSMRPDAEAGGPTWASLGDSRVTRIGALLRKARIDELPQLFNVLRGEMSFVGPRPERPHFVSQLQAAIPFYSDRHYVKPGVTGWAQVSLPYGASIEDARQKLSYDLYYVKNRSLFLDIVIVLSTVRVILFQEGAR